MLTPFDDYPIHQAPVPLAQAGGGHPDHYDRFWFNGYTEDFYFAFALGVYPNRGVIDAAFSVVHDGIQRSVFASGRVPLDRTETRIGPISVEIVEPLRVNRIRVDVPDEGLAADLTYRARTAAFEEARQTRYSGTRLSFDVTRATQLGTWTGSLSSGDADVDLADHEVVYGTKDRSWGVRPVGLPAPMAPELTLPQIFFLWAPLNFADRCLHYMTFEEPDGKPWATSAVQLPIIDDAAAVFGPSTTPEEVQIEHDIRWAPGLRRSNGATLTVSRQSGEVDSVSLEPLLTFRMKGAGYLHPEWGHGHWQGELAVGGESAKVEDLDQLTRDCVHVQQVMRATWGDRTGLGVLEQLVLGRHVPSGFKDLLDGAPAE